METEYDLFKQTFDLCVEAFTQTVKKSDDTVPARLLLFFAPTRKYDIINLDDLVPDKYKGKVSPIVTVATIVRMRSPDFYVVCNEGWATEVKGKTRKSLFKYGDIERDPMSTEKVICIGHMRNGKQLCRIFNLVRTEEKVKLDEEEEADEIISKKLPMKW